MKGIALDTCLVGARRDGLWRFLRTCLQKPPQTSATPPHISHVDHAWSQMFKLMVDDLERALEGDYPYFEYTPRTLENRRGMSACSGVSSRL